MVHHDKALCNFPLLYFTLHTWFVFSKTGLLWVNKAGSKDLEDVTKSLEHVGVKYETLSAQNLRARYPSLTYGDSFSAVYDPNAGVLLADKCLSALQVCTSVLSVAQA